MFAQLPGQVTIVRPSDEGCYFNVDDNREVIEEMIAAGAASDKLKEAFEKGVKDCRNPATVRVTGEVDSFGAEYEYFCKEHYELEKEISQYFKKKYEDNEEQCEWCKTSAPAKEMSWTRDIDEGSNGPVYRVCKDCRDKQYEQINEGLRNLRDDDFEEVSDDYEN